MNNLNESLSFNRLEQLQSLGLSLLLSFLLLIVATAYGLEIYKDQPNPLSTDFGKFYHSLQLAQQGYSPYQIITVLVTENHITSPKPERAPDNLNPPFFQLLISPLGHFSYASALGIWSMLSVGCGILSLLLLEKILGLEKPILNLRLGLLLAFFAYYPTYATIAFGQVTLLLLPLLMGGWLAARRQKFLVASLLLAIAASIKPFFGLFTLYFLVNQQWRALLVFGGTILFCSTLPLLVFNLSTYLDYYRVIHHIHWYTSNWNPSLWGFLLRLFGAHNELFIPLFFKPLLTPILYGLLATGLIGGLTKFLWPDPKTAWGQKTDFDFAALVIAALLLTPLSWVYYFPFLLIPIAILFITLENNSDHPLLSLLMLLTILISSLPLHWINYFAFLILPFVILLSTVKNHPAHHILRLCTLMGILLCMAPFTVIHPVWKMIFIGCGSYFYALVLLLGLVFFTRYHPVVKTPVYQPNTYLYIAVLLPSLFGVIISANQIPTITYELYPKNFSVQLRPNASPVAASSNLSNPNQ